MAAACVLLGACSSSSAKSRASESSKESSTLGIGATTVPGHGPPESTIPGVGAGTALATAGPETTPGSLPNTNSSGQTIVSFGVVDTPSCPVSPTASAPAGKPGRPLTLAWNVTGTTRVVLSIDDPTHRHDDGTYKARSSVTLAFPCDPTVEPDNSHLYTIVAGVTAKTITVSVPTN